ncbi:MAG TPA: DUF4157 domain-containing protein [Acidobacteriota bacterium]|nr:DUF4157 domain-containing protein [Acidobacteriota bacterium]
MNERIKLSTKSREAIHEKSFSPSKKRSKTSNFTVDHIFSLQRTAGNQAVHKLLKARVIQAKLTIGQTGDRYEQEADRVAGDVMRIQEPLESGKPSISHQPYSPFVGRVCSECEEELRRQPTEEEEEAVQTKSSSRKNLEASSDVESKIKSVRSGGQPIPESVRAYFEPRFGRNFSQVRLHNDPDASESARSINALAYTIGQDVVFGSGQYSPETESGRKLIAHELTHVVQQSKQNSEKISRKVSVMDFDQPISNPGGVGINQSNEEAVLDYAFELCPNTAFMVQGGQLSLLDDSFCIPSVLTPDGLFSKAELSNKPTGCGCMCDTILAPDDIKIRIDDTRPANTHFEDGGGTIRVPSPNSKNIPKVQGASGKMIDSPPFIVFGHELCGHYWLNMQGFEDERENFALLALGRDGHDPAIRRENLIRQEHGLEKRGLFRDPCCGIGNPTAEDLKRPSGRCGEQFEKQKNIKNTFANECKHWRDEYNRLNSTNFTTDDVIPEKEGERVPAKWRIEIFFKKDAPQPWLTLLQSLTDNGKASLELAVAVAKKHPEMNVQLVGNASSDKPANDSTYNKRLAKRRAESILNELVKQGVAKERFKTFDATCDKIQDGVHNCSDENSEAIANELDRNVEVKIFNP